MKKRFLALFAFVFIFAGCDLPNNISGSNNSITLTVINGMAQHVNYSIITDTTISTNANNFYSTQHNYVSDHVGTRLQRRLLSPAGTISNGLQLDRDELWLDPGTYDVTIFVCQDNTYTTNQDVYINKATVHFSRDYVINISATGSIY